MMGKKIPFSIIPIFQFFYTVISVPSVAKNKKG